MGKKNSSHKFNYKKKGKTEDDDMGFEQEPEVLDEGEEFQDDEGGQYIEFPSNAQGDADDDETGVSKSKKKTGGFQSMGLRPEVMIHFGWLMTLST